MSEEQTTAALGKGRESKMLPRAWVLCCSQTRSPLQRAAGKMAACQGPQRASGRSVGLAWTSPAPTCTPCPAGVQQRRQGRLSCLHEPASAPCPAPGGARGQRSGSPAKKEVQEAWRWSAGSPWGPRHCPPGVLGPPPGTRGKGVRPALLFLGGGLQGAAPVHQPLGPSKQRFQSRVGGSPRQRLASSRLAEPSHGSQHLKTTCDFPQTGVQAGGRGSGGRGEFLPLAAGQAAGPAVGSHTGVGFPTARRGPASSTDE